MFEIAFVLFAVNGLHRPAVAGLILLLANLPGLILSPVSGSFLNGRNVTRWMALDSSVKAIAILAIALTASASPGRVALTAVLATAMSLTGAFGNVALRSYIALSLEPGLRPPANGVDSMTAGLAVLVGPVIAALIAEWLGTRAGLVCVAAIYFLSALGALRAGEVRPERGASFHFRDAVKQTAAIFSNRILRALTVTYTTYQAALGILVVALPIIVDKDLGANSSWVGICWSVAGGAGIVSSLTAGRATGAGEGVLMFSGMIVTTGAVFLLLAHAYAVVLVLAFLLLGVGVGPIDVGLLGLRQSVLPDQGATALLAVSSAVNVSGYPLGTFIGGLVSVAGSTALVAGSAALAVIGLIVSASLLKTRVKVA
jgi:predicted MFS family arabinose efflux permease